MQQPTVQVRLGVRQSNRFRHREAAGDHLTLSAEHPAASAAHKSGRSRVQLANLAISPHTWSHVLSWCNHQGKHLENSKIT